MAVKSKTDLGRNNFISRSKFKKTKQGNGLRSKPSHGRKLKRGQG